MLLTWTSTAWKPRGLMGYPYFPDNMTAFVTASVKPGWRPQTAANRARSMGIDFLIPTASSRRHGAGLETSGFACQNLFPAHRDGPRVSAEGRPIERAPEWAPGIHYEKYHRLTTSEVEDIVRHTMTRSDTWLSMRTGRPRVQALPGLVLQGLAGRFQTDGPGNTNAPVVEAERFCGTAEA